jgi:hypothetical protein
MGWVLHPPLFFKINVMSILDRIKPQPQTQLPELASNQLSTQEIEVLLSMIKRTSFLGEDIEYLYNLVVKLQSQYTEQTK